MLSENQIMKLESLLEFLEKATSQIDDGTIRVSEAQEILKKADADLNEMLEKDSLEWRIYDRGKKEKTLWWEQSISGYASKSHRPNVEHWIEIVRKILNATEPDFLRQIKRPKKEFYLSAGQEYEAKKTIWGIMKMASTKLSIVDVYLDDSVFDYLESLDPGIEVKLLTADRKPTFKTLYLPFAKKRGKIEARESKDCHDRFIIIDESVIYNLGASINYAGRKAFMINKIEDEQEKKKLTSDFTNWWNTGKPMQ